MEIGGETNRMVEALAIGLDRYASVSTLIAERKPGVSTLCFNEERVRNQVEAFKTGFPGATAWAVKSNPHPHVVKSIGDAGIVEFDVASRQEIELVLGLFPAAQLHFNNPVKSPEDIAFALSMPNVKSFAVDCLEELEKISGAFGAAGRADKSDTMIAVRFKAPRSEGTGNYKFDDKFGALPLEAISIAQAAAGHGFKVGLTFHPGSQNRNPQSYVALMEIGRDITQAAFNGRMSGLSRLNVGGGFPCRYPDGAEPELVAYFQAIKQARKMFDCELVCEPGRALVADSTSLMARINLRRKDDHRLYINDGIYGSFMELPFVDFEPPVRAFNADGSVLGCDQDGEQRFEVWGVTCDSLDKIPKQMVLPSSITTGCYLEFGLMGAYTNATATDFNGIPRSGFVAVDTLASWRST